MEAKLVTIHQFFDNSSSQFYIPVFQREYVWSENNIKQLLDDLENVLNQVNETHFLGNVIYKKNSKDNATLKQLIDGQQRVTSFFLLLNGIKNYLINNNGDENRINQITDLFLENKYVPDKYKFKLKPEVDSTNVYLKIANNRVLELQNDKALVKNNLYKNYKIIEERISEWMTKFGYNAIFGVFNNVKVVEMVIEEKDNIDPHRIFESINSTGLALTNFDLIRNYILMKLDGEEQDKFYIEQWKKFEQELNGLNVSSVDSIIRIMVQFLKKDYVSKKDIYQNFKILFNDKNENEILSELIYALGLYTESFHKENSKTSKVEYNSFVYLEPKQNELLSTVLMLLLDKYKNSLISKKSYENAIKHLSEYSLRRKLADLDTSPITRFFNQTLTNKIINENEGIDIKIKEILFEQNNNTQMYAPTDKEIKERLQNTNFYDLSICKTFFWYIENKENSLSINYEDLTVEHIAPRAPEKAGWKKVLGQMDDENYGRAVNLLGNLTILPDGENKSLSNDSWESKREKLNKFKHIKLNEELITIKNFNYETILTRQEKLIDEFLNIFKK